jgi:hypothetical protein
MVREPLDLALLERAEQLGLEIDPQAADLVEEERAPVRQLELAGLARVRPGEGALLVPEQLGLEQGIGNRGQVHGHERLSPPRALVVDGAGHQLLPGAALRGDQHGGVRLRHLGDHLVEPHHLRVPPHELVEAVGAVELGAQVAQLPLHPALPGRLADQGQDLVHVPGLGQVVVRARLHGVHRHAQVRVGGDQDDRDGLVDAQDPGQDLRPGLARHADVEQCHVHPARGEDREGGGPVGRLQHLELILQDELQRFPYARLVVDGEHHRTRPIGRRAIAYPVGILPDTVLTSHVRVPPSRTK